MLPERHELLQGGLWISTVIRPEIAIDQDGLEAQKQDGLHFLRALQVHGYQKSFNDPEGVPEAAARRHYGADNLPLCRSTLQCP